MLDAGLWMEREAMLHPLWVTQQYCLTSMAAWLSSTGISHHNLLHHLPSICFSHSTATHTLGLLHNPEIPAPSYCAFQGTCIPVRGMYGCGKDYLILLPFRLPQIICFTLSFKCFSSESDKCPDVEIGSLLQFPTHQGQVQSYQHSCFSS